MRKFKLTQNTLQSRFMCLCCGAKPIFQKLNFELFLENTGAEFHEKLIEKRWNEVYFLGSQRFTKPFKTRIVLYECLIHRILENLRI